MRPYPYYWADSPLCHYCIHFDLESDRVARQALAEALIRIGKKPRGINNSAYEIDEHNGDPEDPENFATLSTEGWSQQELAVLEEERKRLEPDILRLADAQKLRDQFDELPRVRCRAFPDGIPQVIYPGARFIHDRPFPGDHNIRFDDGDPVPKELPLDPLAILDRPDLLEALIDKLVEAERYELQHLTLDFPPIPMSDYEAIQELIDQHRDEIETRIEARRKLGKERAAYLILYFCFMSAPRFTREDKRGIFREFRYMDLSPRGYWYILKRFEALDQQDTIAALDKSAD